MREQKLSNSDNVFLNGILKPKESSRRPGKSTINDKQPSPNWSGREVRRSSEVDFTSHNFGETQLPTSHFTYFPPLSLQSLTSPNLHHSYPHHPPSTYPSISTTSCYQIPTEFFYYRSSDIHTPQHHKFRYRKQLGCRSKEKGVHFPSNFR